jgi:hypothetical protein
MAVLDLLGKIPLARWNMLLDTIEGWLKYHNHRALNQDEINDLSAFVEENSTYQEENLVIDAACLNAAWYTSKIHPELKVPTKAKIKKDVKEMIGKDIDAVCCNKGWKLIKKGRKE